MFDLTNLCRKIINDCNFLFLLFVFLAFFFVLFPPSVFGNTEYYYYFFDEKIPLSLDLNMIAIKAQPGGRETAVTKGMSEHNLSLGRRIAGEISPWFFVHQDSPSHSVKSQDNLIYNLAREHIADFVSPVFRNDNDDFIIVTPTIIVRFRDDVNYDEAQGILERYNAGSIVEQNWANLENTYKIESYYNDGIDVLNTSNALAILPEVVFAETDMMFSGNSGLFIPNDPGFVHCWGIHNTGQSGGTVGMDMNGPEAWSITTGDPSIIVVVLDTGVQQNHPDINQRAGADFTGEGGGGGPVNQFDNHGTPVAGCISAIINNGLGTVGIAPDCRIASARTFTAINDDGNWEGQASWTVNALTWAENIGARVTNNSNSYGFTSSSIASKYNQTRNDGMIHFASAGNDSSTSIDYPANLSTVNAIASIDRDGSLSSFSNYGSGLAFSAPGRSIYTTDRTGSNGYNNGGDYVFVNGTSYASPYAAGVAALVLSVDNTLDAFEVEQILQQSATDLGPVGYDTTYGWGLVNAYQAILLSSQPGNLRVSLRPYDAIQDGAKWSVNGDNWYNSGHILTSLQPGDYTVQFNDVPYWDAPSNAFVQVTSEQTTNLTRYYYHWADLTKNQLIDMSDLAVIARQWMMSGCGQPSWCQRADIDRDGLVNESDLAFMAEYWLSQFHGRLYVNTSANGNNSGSSWQNAFTTIVEALGYAVSGDQIWVSQGTYTGRLDLPNGVALYGGFTGVETELHERNWAVNETIISGGINIIDAPSTTTRVDGFTVRDGTGYRSKIWPHLLMGGGIYMSESSPIITNNRIIDNTLEDKWWYSFDVYGGGLYLAGGSPLILGNLISGNTVIGVVDAWTMWYSYAFGGGIYLDGGTAILINNSVIENSINVWGGDWSGDVGGIYIGSGDHYIGNSIIWGNYNNMYPFSSQNIYGACVVEFSNVGNGYQGVGNINVDPLFTDGYRLSANSPCINMANNELVPSGFQKDLEGNPRICHNTVDMGAYEFCGELQVLTPQFSPSGGIYNTEQTVVVSCDTANATIHYTTDGSDPTPNDPVIQSGDSLYIDRSLTLKAKAWRDGFNPSQTRSSDYTIRVATPAFSPNGGTFSVEQNVTITSATPGAIIHYTIDGTEPTPDDPVIASGDSIYVDHSLTLRAKAWKDNFDPSSRTANYNLVVATPVFTPDGCNYFEEQNVVITSSTPDATIHYTTDGSEPIQSDPVIISGHSLPITVHPATTLKARAYKANFTASGIKTAHFRNPAIHYVRPSGNNVNDGLSWADAKQTITSALSISRPHDQIWVAAGTYSGRITVPDSVALYGGFLGVETQLSQRNWVSNETIISGGVNIINAPSTVTRIDGFTVNNGYSRFGGGFYMVSSSPIIVNNYIANNTAEGGTQDHSGGHGGGVYAVGSSPTFINNIITENVALGSSDIGPGYEYDIGGCGGGLYVSGGNIKLINNTIANNRADYRYFSQPESWYRPTGGGLYFASGNHIITNCIIWGNTAQQSAQISGSADVSYSNIQGGYVGQNNIDEDPMFWISWFPEFGYQLIPGSPCIDTGNNDAVPEWLTSDLDGNPRVVDGNNNGQATVDMGCYEAQ